MTKLSIMAAATALLCTSATATPEYPRRTPWLLAEVATCEIDGGKVPHRSLLCRQGTQWVCNSRGSWEDTRKPC